MKNMYYKNLLFFAFFSVVSLSTFAQGLTGSFTVGDSNSDYETIPLAIQDLQTQGVGNGGATFEIIPGTYTQPIVLENIMGLSETNTLTFSAQPGTVTFEVMGTTATSDAIIRVNALSNITFDGFDLVDNSITGEEIEYGYYLVGTATAGCSNNVITNSKIFLGASGARPITATRGIYFSSQGTSLQTSNSNNIIDSVEIDNSSWGIQFRCAASLFGQITQADFNNQVINCTFGANAALGHDFSSGALAINALGGRDMIIRNNLIANISNLNSDPALPVSTSGISLDSSSGEVTENTISNVTYEGTRGSTYGIRSSTFVNDTTLIANNSISGLVRGNFIASTTDPSLNLTGLWIFNQGGNNGLARVLHNSIFLEADAPVTYSTGGVQLSGGSTGQFPGEVYNNIIVNNIPTADPAYRSFALVDGNTARGFLLSDNNDLYADAANAYLGVIGRELGGNEQFTNDLQDFITISETNENSVSFLPEFMDASAGDLSFSETITVTPEYFVPTLPEVPTDIEGTTRSTPETYLGAYEGPELLSIADAFVLQVAVYPNPASEVINLNIPNFGEGFVSIKMFDALGRQVLVINNMEPTADATYSIPLTGVQKGMYYLNINANNLETTKKIVVR
ncbi:T9SS type A sorting domain-containing protein [Aequorivita echinoideorum]|uniref:T9SS type A sorting domain-containing protein n=1 Tax=Aequorivita echinoideorum TaxID=1549647 RepID=A0ABS5S3Z2_9FLAO|nr:T9SS type A sorting domain-containing protein [Aequorivita echinoideorum]MBT0607926.1 T9SS type A sorting domain-containing protein [Aequorivita echinoideorum]